MSLYLHNLQKYILTQNVIISNIPSEFNYFEYINNYSEARFMNKEQAYKHYLNFGKNHGYTCDTNNLKNFDIESYKKRNDIICFDTNDDVLLYYIRYGQFENQIDAYDKFAEKLIDTVFINLDRRTDRLIEITNELKHAEIVNYSRFAAICPSIDEVKKCNMIDINKLWKKNMRPPYLGNQNDEHYIIGATGCKLSHYNVLKNFHELSTTCNKIKYLLVLEDDFVFDIDAKNKINNTLKSIEDYGIIFNILYLSVTLPENNYKQCVTKISDNLLKIKKGYGNATHAMIFNKNTVKNVINIIEHSNNEIDVVYKNLVDNRFMINPLIGYQRECISDIGQYRSPFITEKGMFYGKLSEQYHFDDVQITNNIFIYNQPDIFLMDKYKQCYDYLNNDKNLCSVNKLDKQHLFILFGMKYVYNIKYILVNISSFSNEVYNMAYKILEFDKIKYTHYKDHSKMVFINKFDDICKYITTIH